MSKIELVVLDIDGILTDGKKYYDQSGMPFAKTYCDKDFTAIKRLRGAGINVCFLSGDENVNKAMAENRNIDFYSARGKDKADFIPIFEKEYSTSSSNMVYFGDDLFDLSIMQKVGLSCCPIDAPTKVRKNCSLVLPYKGGENLVCRLYDILLENQLIEDCTMQDIEDLDKNEKF